MGIEIEIEIEIGMGMCFEFWKRRIWVLDLEKKRATFESEEFWERKMFGV